MLTKTIKRFYKTAETAEGEGGFAIRLDGRQVKTPAGKPLVVAARPLAEAVAEEWRAQGETVDPASMPMMQLAATALDRAGPERAAIIDQLMSYAGTDLLCYRADFPPDLVDRQDTGWTPVLDWAARVLDARLQTTSGVIAVAQPADALTALRRKVEAYDVWRLTALQLTTAAAGSLVLALALVEGELDAERVFALSQLDETYQIEQWGEDAEAAERRAALARDIRSAERFLSLI
ncbi:MAG: ATP12 family protein [Pseudomonadota bacterium]